MKPSSLFIIALLFIGLGMSQPAYRQSNGVLIAPRVLNYQGYLTDTSGNQFNGEATVKATIYNSGVAGQPLWSETINNVLVDQGIFNVVLGNLTPIPDSVFREANDRWLEVSVNSYTFAPRTQITAAAGAFEALWSKTASYALAGSPDNDWVVGTGAQDSTLLTGNRLGISRGGVGNISYDSYRCTHVNLGVACTTGINGENGTYMTIPGGYRNVADSNAATVAGGARNHAGPYSSYVGGGYGNASHGNFSVVAGGCKDTVFGDYGGILSGSGNVAGTNEWQDTAMTILGGLNNLAINDYVFVGNGKGAEVEQLATVLNGRNIFDGRFLNATAVNGDSCSLEYWNDYCLINGHYQRIISSSNCIASGLHDTVGYYNFAGFGFVSLIAGGQNNVIQGDYNFIGGGRNNKVFVGFDFDSDYGAIGGGFNNTVNQDPHISIGGGLSNDGHEFGAVIGGSSNQATDRSAIGGGYENDCYFLSAAVGGGQNHALYCGFAANNRSHAGVDYGDTIRNTAAFNGQTANISGATSVGIIAKGSGAFSIDHPLDPGGKILNHYFAESPEMVLMYRGTVKIGANGRVDVHLPNYFEELNRNPMVKVTGVGTSDVHVAEKVSGNRFVISGPPGTEVHWLVTGDRKDHSAEIVRLLKPVEQDKGMALTGRSMDDNFLLSSLPQLERMGKAAGFDFRNPVNWNKYEDMKRSLEEAKTGESSADEGRQP